MATRLLIAVLLGLVAVAGCRADMPPAVSAQTPESTEPAPAPTTSGPPAATVGYTNPVYHWSITYPSSYNIDTSEPEWIKLSASDPFLEVGVHSFQADQFGSVDEVVDWMLDQNERFFQAQGLHTVVVSRRPITLPNDVSGIDVVKEIQPGGKSRDIYVLIGDQAYFLSAETYGEFWDEVKADFDGIIHSFTVERPR